MKVLRKSFAKALFSIVAALIFLNLQYYGIKDNDPPNDYSSYRFNSTSNSRWALKINKTCDKETNKEAFGDFTKKHISKWKLLSKETILLKKYQWKKFIYNLKPSALNYNGSGIIYTRYFYFINLATMLYSSKLLSLYHFCGNPGVIYLWKYGMRMISQKNIKIY